MSSDFCFFSNFLISKQTSERNSVARGAELSTRMLTWEFVIRSNWFGFQHFDDIYLISGVVKQSSVFSKNKTSMFMLSDFSGLFISHRFFTNTKHANSLRLPALNIIPSSLFSQISQNRHDLRSLFSSLSLPLHICRWNKTMTKGFVDFFKGRTEKFFVVNLCTADI